MAAIASGVLFYLFFFSLSSLAYKEIQLPGLYYDEMAFVNAGPSGSDTTFILCGWDRWPF